MNEHQLLDQFEQDARADQEFVVLTLAASMIATLGLLANSSAVVIGAMLIAPWMLPLRAIAFAILQGRLRLVATALLTLLIGVALTVGLSVLLGFGVGLPILGSEVAARTQPNLLDLGVALVAGAIAAYASVRSKALSSLAGTAIAVALVPPVCAFGLLLSKAQWGDALGAALLFAANLLGILSGGLIALAICQPELRVNLWRSRLGLVSLLLTALLLVPLSGSFLSLVSQARRTAALQQIQEVITASLKDRTLTLGKDAELVNVRIDWSQNPPLIRAAVRVTNPRLPTARQVAAVQAYINDTQPIRYRLVVQRLSVDVVGPETEPNPPEQVPPDPPPLAPSVPTPAEATSTPAPPQPPEPMDVP
ncbi:DUF389 domain-containing protein [Synechococcus sp. FGCU-3]|nr:DUF389 domain-containing protein [Synechococcus sp. FGCU3]